MYARWGKRAWWAAAAIAVLAAVAGGWYARASQRIPLPEYLVMRGGSIEPWWEPTPDQQAYAEESGQPLALLNSQGQRFVLIPPGRFRMGPDWDWAAKLADQRPHTVEVLDPFYMGSTEVTNQQYRRFDRGHDSGLNRAGDLNGDRQPVVGLTWTRTQAYCLWLTQEERKAGLITRQQTYRLPTEAEWEYACRAGTTTPWSFAGSEDEYWARVSDYEWFDVQHPDRLPPPASGYAQGVSHAVGMKKANPWGLYDMYGNVAEWTQSLFLPYPYSVKDGRDLPVGTTLEDLLGWQRLSKTGALSIAIRGGC